MSTGGALALLLGAACVHTASTPIPPAVAPTAVLRPLRTPCPQAVLDAARDGRLHPALAGRAEDLIPLAALPPGLDAASLETLVLVDRRDQVSALVSGARFDVPSAEDLRAWRSALLVQAAAYLIDDELVADLPSPDGLVEAELGGWHAHLGTLRLALEDRAAQRLEDVIGLPEAKADAALVELARGCRDALAAAPPPVFQR